MPDDLIQQAPSDQPLPPPSSPESSPKQESFLGEIVRFTILALIIVLPIRIFIAQPFIVSGASMDPTFETNEYLIVDQLSLRFNNPARGQVVIFKYPKDETKFFIKRVIGLPGETILISNGKVMIKNTAYPEGFILDEPYISSSNTKDEEFTIALKKDEYFVMGDNRRQSSDSRAWGSLQRKLIVGTPFVRLYPLNKVDITPGSFKEAR